MRRRRQQSRALALSAALLFAGLALAWAPGALSADTPAHVGSEACHTCHASEAAAWAGSHHSWALRPPTPESVLGDFGNARFDHKGLTSRFFRKDGRYFVETDGADGKLATFEIKYAVGVAPLQQYLVELDGGRLQALDIAWDVNAKRWFHLYPDEDVSAGNGLHWSGPYKNWQARCAVCHQTDFRKNYDVRARGYRSQWSELSIGCESCHGPGEAHIAWSRQASDFDPAAFSNVDAKGLVRPEGTGKQAAEENMCGPCHARREPLGADSPLAGARLGDHYNLSPLLGGLYFADGQQRDEVYVLGSFLQSKMHKAGVTCTNCHEPHSAKLVAIGNALCTQCHNEVGRADFPTLKPRLFDSSAHHHHAPGSAAAQCVSCHMPERNYMVVDGRRDHFFRVPDPLLSEKVGSPDACRACHEKETAAWASEHIRQWAGGRSVPTSAYAEAFAAAQRGRMDHRTRNELAAIAGDGAQAAIVRATALRVLADEPSTAQMPPLAPLIADRSELVRSAATRIPRQLPVRERISLLVPLLGDPVASVRLAAALELSSAPPEAVPAAARQALRMALDELKASLAAKADFPEAQMAVGGHAMTARDWPAAEAAFAEAALMDPQLVESWLVRARIRAALGDPVGAIDILAAGRTRNPENAQIAFDLASLLIGQGEDERAIPLLRDLVRLEPANRELRATLAVTLLRSRKLAEAGVEIGALLQQTPYDANALILHGLHQLLTGNLAGARKTAQEIVDRYPGLTLPPQLEALRQMR